MGCCGGKNKGQQSNMQQTSGSGTGQAQNAQGTSTQNNVQSSTNQDGHWLKKVQRTAHNQIVGFNVIGSAKSSTYDDKVQVLEAQKNQKEAVSTQDIQIEFGTGKQEDPVWKQETGVKVIQLDKEEDVKRVHDRLKDVKQKVAGIPGVCQFDFRACQSTQNQKFYVEIFMPFASNGTLEENIEERSRQKMHYSGAEILGFMNKSIQVLKDLQQKKIVHTDIKPQNYLLIESRSIQNAKLSDFRVLDDFCSAFPGQHSTHLEYLAPILRDEKLKLVQHNKYKSDLFSLGLVWLRLATLKDIRGLNSEQDVANELQQLRDASKIREYDDNIVNNIAAALQFDETKRPDFTSFPNPGNQEQSQNVTITALMTDKNRNQIKSRFTKVPVEQQSRMLQGDEWDMNRYHKVVQNSKNSCGARISFGDEDDNVPEKIQDLEPVLQEALLMQKAVIYGGDSFAPQLVVKKGESQQNVKQPQAAPAQGQTNANVQKVADKK